MEQDKKTKDISSVFNILKDYPKKEIEDILYKIMGLVGVESPNQSQQTKEDKTVLNFYREKKPKNKMEELLVLCYFLEKYNDLEWFTSKDIERVIGEARLPKISKMNQLFYKLKQRKNWIRTEGKKHQLTHAGIDFVEKELPKKK